MSRCLDRLVRILPIALSAGLLAGAAASAGAATLYDPALGSLPSAQGWLTTGTPGYVQSVVGGSYRFDTTASNAVMAGSARAGLAGLDAGAGFELDLVLRVATEMHARPERGGFSLLVTGTDPRAAIELAFWQDRVFAYTASFQHGAEALLDTGAATAYALVVAAGRYTLYAGGAPALSGALVDYSAFGAPYNQPGLLFFGDDTSSAAAAVEVGRIDLVGAVPEPGTLPLALVGLGLLALRIRSRRGSTP